MTGREGIGLQITKGRRTGKRELQALNGTFLRRQGVRAVVIGNHVTTKFDCLTAYRRHYNYESTLVGLVEDWKQAKDSVICVYPFNGHVKCLTACIHH